MGQLRTVPKKKPLLTDDQYDHYLGVLREARTFAKDHELFFDLEEGESPNKVKKAMKYVAESEDMDVTIRHIRGENTLKLRFKSSKSTPRISAEAARERILNALKESDRPLSKNDVLEKTGISPSTWNLRIRELVDEGGVIRTGERRDAVYQLP